MLNASILFSLYFLPYLSILLTVANARCISDPLSLDPNLTLVPSINILSNSFISLLIEILSETLRVIFLLAVLLIVVPVNSSIYLDVSS